MTKDDDPGPLTPRDFLFAGFSIVTVIFAGAASIEAANATYVLIDPGPCGVTYNQTINPPAVGPHCVTAVLSWVGTFAVVFFTTIAAAVYFKRRIFLPPPQHPRRGREE